ncbi:MAG TPA: CocE/NonD family hydrolase [Anaerolineales bacterium]|nr:CocE/NonD family hydrolase [Anaerolineales bacterium]
MKTMKQYVFKKKVLISITLVLILLFLGSLSLRTGRQEMLSEFGIYQGYTEEIYDSTQRTSDYLTLSDGTRLAYDLIIPTKKGIPADTPLPVLLSYTPYGRTWTIFDEHGKFLVGGFVDTRSKIMAHIRYWISGDEGRIMDPIFKDRWLGPVIKHGYIVISVDRPGTGASFSSPTPGSMETAAKFLNEIIDWIVAQPWSDGNVGMYGESQLAMVQFAAAAAGNPHLKAILPASSPIEMYQSVMYPGGVFDKAFTSLYGSVALLETMATPVDSDPEGKLLAQARASRNSKVSAKSALEIARQYPFRDGIAADGTSTWQLIALDPFIERINQAQTPIYMTVGWYDVFTADIFYWYDNLRAPKRLTVRPTDHSQASASLGDLDYGTEALRWLDYWLKGIDNGIMDEPPIHYYLQDGPMGGTWRTSEQWPLATQKSTSYYFGPGKSGSVGSVNDGSLTPNCPTIASAADTYTVDYTTTTGSKSRWNAVEVAHHYPDLSSNDAKALTYTTSPLEADLEVTGHPVVHLWLTTRASDLDVFVYLEEVDTSGNSTYITEGNLRASHRKLVQPPFNNLGLPYQSHFEVDQLPIPEGEPFEMVFHLLPTSFQFHTANRIRVTVAFADADNFDTPILNPVSQLQLLRDLAHLSYVELPVNK